jgi:hypothetical protein
MSTFRRKFLPGRHFRAPTPRPPGEGHDEPGLGRRLRGSIRHRVVDEYRPERLMPLAMLPLRLPCKPRHACCRRRPDHAEATRRVTPCLAAARAAAIVGTAQLQTGANPAVGLSSTVDFVSMSVSSNWSRTPPQLLLLIRGFGVRVPGGAPVLTRPFRSSSEYWDLDWVQARELRGGRPFPPPAPVEAAPVQHHPRLGRPPRQRHGPSVHPHPPLRGSPAVRRPTDLSGSAHAAPEVRLSAESTRGGGRKACRGSDRPALRSHRGRHRAGAASRRRSRARRRVAAAASTAVAAGPTGVR